MMIEPNAPIDAVHAESLRAVADIRRHVAAARRRVALWQPAPRPR